MYDKTKKAFVSRAEDGACSCGLFCHYAAGVVACIVFLVCIVWSCKIFRD